MDFVLNHDLKRIDNRIEYLKTFQEGDWIVETVRLERERSQLLLSVDPLEALPHLRDSDSIAVCRPLETMQALLKRLNEHS